MFEELLERWANQQGFETWAKDHSTVLRNLSSWVDNLSKSESSICQNSEDGIHDFHKSRNNEICINCGIQR